MTEEYVTVPTEVERDRFGRPLVVPPGGGKPVPYTRCTTFVGSIEDTYNLSKWQQRMVAVGLVQRPDLSLAVSAHREDKARLNELVEQAMEAAQAHAGATKGTALHSLTEQMDRGQEPTGVPPEFVPDLEAYAKATAPLRAVHIEEFCVQDPLKVGGTPDRVVEFEGKRYIADLKTGSISYGYLKIAAQLAMYARSQLYNPTTQERTDHGAERDKGIIVHLPAGSGTCSLHWVDLVEGWEAVKLCNWVRQKRALTFKQLVREFRTAEVPTDVAQPALPLDGVVLSLADQITACSTRAEVEALWSARAAEWTEDHTAVAKAHLATLGGV